MKREEKNSGCYMCTKREKEKRSVDITCIHGLLVSTGELQVDNRADQKTWKSVRRIVNAILY